MREVENIRALFKKNNKWRCFSVLIELICAFKLFSYFKLSDEYENKIRSPSSTILFMKNTFLLLLFCCLLQSCGQSFIYEKDIALPENTWNYENTLDFPFEVTDVKALQNLYLDITHSTEFKTQNLYVQFHTKSPSGKVVSDMVSLELAEKNGVWFGNCGGTWCDLRIPIQSGAYFEETGTYTLSIEQYTRTDVLKGVKSMGFRVEKTNKMRK